MKDILRISGRLAIICAAAAVSLAGVNMVTAPRIKEYQQEQLHQALSAVAAGYEISEQSIPSDDSNFPEITSFYPLYQNTESAGYILLMTASGYGGPMELIAGYKASGELINARLLQNSETPGLGKEAEKDTYMEMFAGSGGENSIPARKSELPEDRADAVSGSTITFTGIAKALSTGSAFVKNRAGSEK
ncbi:MAG: FMN-binding protein [Spirochaetia bacterium]|nr:FMN-binding protein [Spirochaetia bacterium]